MNYHGKLIRNGTVVIRTSSPNYLVTMELQIASSIFYKRLISYRGLVKWYNNGLQNLCWVFDIDKRCHSRKKTQILVLCQIVLVDNNLIQGIDNMKDDFYHPFIVLETKNILAMK